MRKVVLHRMGMIFLLLVLITSLLFCFKLILQGFLSDECTISDVFGAAIAMIFLLLFTCIIPVIYRFFRRGFGKKPAIMTISNGQNEVQAEYKLKLPIDNSIKMGEDGLPDGAFC